MKTYSVAIKVKKGYWVTNIGKYFSLNGINWKEVLHYCIENNSIAFGYYYGHKSNKLTSPRCRTELAYLL